MPDLERARQLKELDRGLYKQWRRETKAQSKHNRFMEAGPLRIPARTAQRGQWLGLTVVLGVLALAGYALDQHEPWIATFLTALDLAGLAAAFFRRVD